MRFPSWQFILAGILVAFSGAGYYAHYMLFGDARILVKDFIEFTALFLIHVIIATFIIEGFLNHRDKQILLKKMNMAIGMFYSEVGVELLRRFASLDLNSGDLAKKLRVTDKWTDKDFRAAEKVIGSSGYSIKLSADSLGGLKEFLLSKRAFLLMLLENPNLLEHEAFTDVLWAVFHLTEELTARKDLNNLNMRDTEHMILDIKRAYSRTTAEWLCYMKHLRKSYPYLFSFASRTNPFDPDVSVELG